jgi:hypothetical protein
MCVSLIAGLGTAAVGAMSANRAARAQSQAAQSQLDTMRDVRDENLGIGQNVLNRQMTLADQTAAQQRQAAMGMSGNQMDLINQALRGQIADYRGAADQFRPFARSGRQANNALAYEMGFGEMPNNYRGFQETPGYAFRRDEALRGAEGSAAASGMLMSGQTLRDLAGTAGGIADQAYGQHVANLQGITDRGMAAAGGIAGLRAAQAQARAGASAQRLGVSGGLGANLMGIAGARGGSMQNALGQYAANAFGANQNYGAGAMTAQANMGGAQASGFMGMHNALMQGVGTGAELYSYLNNVRRPGQAGAAGAAGVPAQSVANAASGWGMY